MKISALVLAKNEQEMIEEALKQLNFADEIIILDQNSTDKTVEIAKKYTSKIITSNDGNFDANRNLLAKIAKGEWLLYVDPDERLTEELIEEIKSVTKTTEHSAFLGPQSSSYSTRTAKCSAFYLSRKNYILGKIQNHGGWWPDFVPRLFKKSDFLAWEGNVHESPKVKGTFGYLKNPIYHKTARTLSQMLEKSTKWAKIEAELNFKAKSPKVTIAKTLKFSIAEFIWRYFIKFGALDGKIGLMSAIYQAVHKVIVFTYLWELQNEANKAFKKIQK